MSASVCVGYLRFGATGSHFCKASLSLSYGAFVSSSSLERESPDGAWELEQTKGSALAQLEPPARALRPTMAHLTDGWPGNLRGTLQGPMAGKRPPRNI
jgi:hypothetical protein